MAKIVQVITVPDKNNQFVLRGNVTRGTYSWDDAVLLDYAGPRLLEDDVVEVVGTVTGLFTYEAVLGNEVTVPHIRVVASQRVEEVDRAVITQTPMVVVETVEVEKEVVKEVVVEVEKLVVQKVVVEKVVEVEGRWLWLLRHRPQHKFPPPCHLQHLAPPKLPHLPITTPEPPSTPAELVERVQDSIVRIRARSGGTFFGTTSQGSGFIFAVEGTTAFVATNHHIIDGSNSVEVQIEDSTYDALVLGWDAERDVAVVSICCSSDFIALPWGHASPSEGESVIAIGYPNSDTGNLIATIGEVRAPDDLSTAHDFIPHSAPLNPGNSGGPLFSMPGAEVVGINTAGGTETLAFYAVPYQAIEQQVADWRSQLVIVPEPTPSPIIPFATIEGEDFSYTVHEIRDPAEPRSEIGEGHRLVAIDVLLVALVDDAYYNLHRFSLQDEDGYVWNNLTWPDIEPRLRDGDLSTGQRTRGWIGFEVPQSAVLTGVFYDESGSSGRVVIADLTSD